MAENFSFPERNEKDPSRLKERGEGAPKTRDPKKDRLARPIGQLTVDRTVQRPAGR